VPPNQRLQLSGAAEYGTVAFVRLAGTLVRSGRMGRPRFLRPQLRRDSLGGPDRMSVS
jgi:hypothetical protein